MEPTLKLAHLLQEIFRRSQISAHRLPVEFSGERTSDYYNSVKEFSFSSGANRYVSEFEFYNNDIVAVSFRAELPDGHEGNKYAYLSNDPENLKVFNTVMHQVLEMADENPLLSFVILGGADVQADGGLSMDNNKRFRIYLHVADKAFSKQHYKVISDAQRSALAIVSLEKLAQQPDLEEKVHMVIRVNF